jgi:hypothetical protein
MRELAVLVGHDADGQRHDGHPQDVTASIASQEVTGFAIVFRVLVGDEFVKDLEDQLARGLHLVEGYVEDEVITTDVTDEALLGEPLHDIVQQSGEHADDAVPLVVAVAVVELLEVIQVRVADGEQLVAVYACSDVTLDLDGTRQPRGRVHAHVAFRAVEHHAQAQRLLAVVHQVRQHLVGACLERFKEAVAVFARDEDDNGHNGGERIAFQHLADASRIGAGADVDADTRREAAVDERDDFGGGDTLDNDERMFRSECTQDLGRALITRRVVDESVS